MHPNHPYLPGLSPHLVASPPPPKKIKSILCCPFCLWSMFKLLVASPLNKSESFPNSNPARSQLFCSVIDDYRLPVEKERLRWLLRQSLSPHSHLKKCSNLEKKPLKRTLKNCWSVALHNWWIDIFMR